MPSLQVFTIIAPLAFLVGFALQKGNVCSVLAARQLVWTGRHSRLIGLGLASAWGLVLILPLHWFGVEPFHISRQVTPGVFTILAGVVYGLGCYINGACIFGVCSRLAAGHISFVFAIPAMAIGATLGQYSGLTPIPSAPTFAASFHSPMFVLWVAISVWLIWNLAKLLARYRRSGIKISQIIFQARWRSALAATVIGALGSLLFATGVAWFYPAAVKKIMLFAFGTLPEFPLESFVGGGMLFIGAVTAGLAKGRMLVRPPHLVPSLRAAAGGLVIGVAWAFIPGGNDALVLYLLPSLALNGIVAYGAMLATLIFMEYLKKRHTLLG